MRESETCNSLNSFNRCTEKMPERNKPKLSIIVPVYDVERYLIRCIDSILSQIYQEFEVILVDDGSPDHCGEIIDDYAKRDHRVVPLHQVNKGVSAARNAGLRIAKGKYIGFVDPDDWIEPTMYRILINRLEEEDCDIVSCTWMNNDDKGNEIPYHSTLSSKVMSGEEYMSHLFDIPPTIFGSVWSKVIRKSIIETEFPEYYAICEDNYFLANCCANSKKAAHINQPLYHFFHRNSSATRKEPGKVVLGLAARRDIISIARNVNEECGNKAELVFLDQCIYFCNKLKRDESKYRELAKKEFLTYIRRNKHCIIVNKQISLKQKVYFILKYKELLAEKGN